MVVSGWKEFAFFDATPVKDPSPAHAPLYSDPELLEIVPGQDDTVFMSTRAGLIREFNADMQLISEFKVCDSEQGKNLDFIRVVPKVRFLVTVVSKLGHPLEITVWNLKNYEVHSRAVVNNGTNTFPVTAFSMADDISVLVIGFADGSVIVVRGDMLHDKGTRQRLVHTANTGITGLALTDSSDDVFVSSVNQVLVVSTTNTKSIELLDKAKGADLGCTSKAADSQFLIARDSDLAWFNTKHRGPSIELPVARKQIYMTRGSKYLVVVASMDSGNRSLLNTDTLRLMIFDLNHHVIAFNAHLSNGIRAIFEQWDRLNVIGSNGMMYVIKEKPLEARISLLKSRKLYQVAIKMAEEADTQQMRLMLHQDYADYLFEKNDIDASLREYVAAIDLGQSSRAIRRFKDSQHASTLLQYLDALYTRGLSSPQHVTLQIICYTKLKKLDELSEFLRTATELENFDFERAVAVLTEQHDSEFAELAAYVAEKWPDPDLVVQIRLRHMEDVQSTLDYIQTVSVADALRVLIQNSRLLLNKLPVETTGVLITLFTGKFIPRDSNTLTVKRKHDTSASVGTTDEAKAPVLQSYQAFLNFLSSASYLGSHIVSAETLEAEVEQPSYLPPRPRLIFPSFIGHENEFVIFLEACLNVAPNFHSSEKDLSDIATTLFEMYLHVGATDRARKLVDDYATVLYRVNVQTVSKIYHFKLSSEQMIALGSSYVEVLHECVETGDVDTALRVFYKYANEDSAMALQTIQLLSSDQQALDKVRAKSSNELEKLCRAAVASGISPVELISVLSSSPYVTIGDVKSFIEGLISTTNDQVKRHQKMADSYENEIKDKREALEESRNTTMVFPYNNCSQCNQSLDLPAYHFACKHSYHQQCIGSESECPICSPEIENMESLRAHNEETAAQQDYFLSELGRRSDKAKVVLDFISRGGLSEVN